MPKALDERFMPEPNSGCWLWTGGVKSDGYGSARTYGARRSVLAHRFMYELLVGPIPDGLELDHVCRVRSCVNPDHLDIVTHAENIARKPIPASCPSGHRRFSVRGGKRHCLDCGRARNKLSYRAKNPVQVRRGREWLADDERAAIRELIRQGKTHSQIAPLVGVSIATISRVRNSDA